MDERADNLGWALIFDERSRRGDTLRPPLRACPFTNPGGCLLQPRPAVNRGRLLCVAGQKPAFPRQFVARSATLFGVF